MDRECLGEDAQHVWQSAWDGTLHCPHCHLPGWTVAGLMAHLGKPCSGDRNKEIRARDANLHRDMVTCDKCEIMIHKAMLADHICGLPYDAVWLGQVRPESLAITYVDYISRIQPPHGPCGFGGIHLGPKADGALKAADRTREELIADSYTVPWSVRNDWNLGTAGDLMYLMRQLSCAILSESRLEAGNGGEENERTIRKRTVRRLPGHTELCQHLICYHRPIVLIKLW